jgi:hypothetical protein
MLCCKCDFAVCSGDGHLLIGYIWSAAVADYVGSLGTVFA